MKEFMGKGDCQNLRDTFMKKDIEGNQLLRLSKYLYCPETGGSHDPIKPV